MRRLLVPEVVQTSAMDCGPASLACLLEGYGIRASYGRLREACQTGVDGTSIDTMEEIVVSLGLDAEQVMLPPDHLLLHETDALPAIVVTRQPNGFTHFVVVWSRNGPLVQVMDPATGRRWVTRESLLRELYIHEMDVPVEDVQAWLESPEFDAPLRRRTRDLGIGVEGHARLVSAAGAGDLAGRLTLDASVRMAASLVRSAVLRAGREAERFVAVSLAEPSSIPPAYFTARQPPGGAAGEVRLRGAVLVRVRGVRPAGGERPDLTPELARALDEPPVRPLGALGALIREGGWLTPSTLLVAMTLASVGAMIEAVLLRSALNLPSVLATVRQRLGATGLLVVFVLAVRMLAYPLSASSLRIGRQVEIRLRKGFLEKLTRLGDRYFQSRTISDMAERAHAAQAARSLPDLGARVLRSTAELIVTTAAIVWLDPQSASSALSAALLAVVVPVLWQPALVERDLRTRAHAAALSRLALDALLGLMPIRTHAAERPMRREHENLLVEWGRASRRLVRAAAWAEAIQSLVVTGAIAWMLVRYVGRASDTSGVILLTYWGLSLPLLGEDIALSLRQYPGQRNVMMRLLEPLGALEEAPVSSGDKHLEARGAGAHIAMRGVSVVAGGHTILEGVDLEVKPGEKVAIVGASGAGKSSLVALLLGWHRPARGVIEVDGHELDLGRLEALRRTTAWVDPAVQIWNRPLLDNLCYGAGPEARGALAEVLDSADIHPLLARLPDGMQTALGEGGTLVSGGEGQRVRLGRAMMRRGARLAILDEPFRGLDRERRRVLLSRARAWWGDATLLCVTHDVAETLEFDRVIVVDGGRLVEDAPPSVLKADPASRYAAMLRAEEALMHTLWGGPEWRRLRMESGRLRGSEGPA